MKELRDLNDQERAFLNKLQDLSLLDMTIYCCLIMDPYNTFTIDDMDDRIGAVYPKDIVHDAIKRLAQLNIVMNSRSRDGKDAEWETGWSAARDV